MNHEGIPALLVRIADFPDDLLDRLLADDLRSDVDADRAGVEAGEVAALSAAGQYDRILFAENIMAVEDRIDKGGGAVGWEEQGIRFPDFFDILLGGFAHGFFKGSGWSSHDEMSLHAHRFCGLDEGDVAALVHFGESEDRADGDHIVAALALAVLCPELADLRISGKDEGAGSLCVRSHPQSRDAADELENGLIGLAEEENAVDEFFLHGRREFLHMIDAHADDGGKAFFRQSLADGHEMFHENLRSAEMSAAQGQDEDIPILDPCRCHGRDGFGDADLGNKVVLADDILDCLDLILGYAGSVVDDTGGRGDGNTGFLGNRLKVHR